jgi:hypothetical protein
VSYLAQTPKTAPVILESLSVQTEPRMLISQLSYQAAFQGSHIQRQLSIRVKAANLRRTRFDPKLSKHSQ